MPKKGKGGKGKKGKKGKKKKGKDESSDVMSPEEMAAHILRLREELDREREERNWFQQERDKVNNFWEITKKKLEDKESDLRNVASMMEDTNERHRLEIKVYKQKVKYLIYEHKKEIDRLKAEHIVRMKLAKDESAMKEMELRKEKRDLKVQLKEQQLSHQDEIKGLQMAHEEALAQQQDEFEKKLYETENKYRNRLKEQREELELRKKTEIQEVEERKNLHIDTLMKNHEKAFSDMKGYYNDITLNNLALINTLQEQMEATKRKDDLLEKRIREVEAENRRLSQPLSQATVDLEMYKKKLSNFDNVKMTYGHTKRLLAKTKEQLKETTLENEVLSQRLHKVQLERDELYAKFLNAIHEVFQKTGLKNLILEKKLCLLEEVLEKKDIQLNEVLASCNIDPNALSIITRKIEDVLHVKNMAIRDLQYEVARVCKSHNDLMGAYEARLAAFGIPMDETGFTPLQTLVHGQVLGKGPAGLVSVPKF